MFSTENSQKECYKTYFNLLFWNTYILGKAYYIHLTLTLYQIMDNNYIKLTH